MLQVRDSLVSILYMRRRSEINTHCELSNLV